MSFKKRLIWTVIVLLVLLSVQILTYRTVAIKQLDKELLTEPFRPYTYLEDTLDSAYVRDFFVADCLSGTVTFYSHKLNDRPEALKKKLGVKFIEFQDESVYLLTPPAEKKYKLVYHTWTYYKYESFRPSDFFAATQIEELIINGNVHRRQSHFRWILFFWMKPFEQIESIYNLSETEANRQHKL